jgi:methylated-DNA-protein-cysteine methyltransferase-like protein
MSRKYDLPWHRVINAKGQVAIQEDASFNEQVMSLQAEGVTVTQAGMVDIETFQWHPHGEIISTN